MPFSATKDLWLVLKARDEGSRAMRSFSRDIRMVGDSVRQANMQAARSALQNQLAMQRLTGATQADIIATQNRISQVDRDIHSMRVARAAMEENRISAQRLGTALTGASAIMTAVGTGMLIAGGLGTAAMGGLVKSAIEYQKQSSLTRTQVDKFAVSLRDIEDIGLRIANKIGVVFRDIQPALFDIFSSMEIGAAEAEKLLEIFSKAAVAGQTSIQSASRATIGILNAFQLPLTSVNHLMDLQFQLVQEGIGTYEEWTQRIGLVSPSAVRAGQSVETMLAALAATTRIGISAARSGTAVARAFDAMSNPKAVSALKGLGVNALDASGKFRPIIDVLGEFRAVLMKLPESQRIAKILEVFKGAGGTIEARRFLQSMLLTPGTLELFKTIFDEMSKESGSFEQAYAVMADSAAVKSQLLANKWETLKVKAGEALIPVFLKIVDALGKVFDWFNRLDPKTQRIITLSVSLALVLTTLGGIVLLVLGTIAGFAAAVATAGSALFIVLGIMTAVGLAFAALAAAVALAWAKSEGFRNIVKDTAKQVGDFHNNYIIPTGKAIRDAWEKHMRPAFDGLANIIETRVMPVVRQLQALIMSEFFKTIIELGNNIKDVLVFAFEHLGNIIQKVIIPIIERATQFYRDHKTTIDQIIQALMFLGKWILKIALVLGGILAVVLIGPVVGAFAAAIAIISGIIVIIVKLIEWIKVVINWFRGLDDITKKALTNVKDVFNKVLDFIRNSIERVKEFFSLDTLRNAGEKLIDGLIQGIKNKLGSLGNVASKVAQTIKDFLPFSPAKTGPLSGKGSPYISGQKIGKMLAQGMASKMDLVSSVSGLIASASTMRGPSLSGVSDYGSNRTYNQKIIVNTQELDPRRQAAELGWLLAGR